MTNYSPQANRTDLPTTAEYNASRSCSLDISYFITSRKNSAIAYTCMAIGSVLCGLTAVVGNSIILLVLHRCKSLLPATKALFYSLAISDFAVGLEQPLFTTYLLAISSRNEGLYCAVGLPYSLTSSFLGLVSLWSLTVIALDRYLALHLGIRYKAEVTVKRVVAALAFGWFLIAVCTVSFLLTNKLRQIIGNLLLLTCLVLSLYFYIKNYFTLRQHKLQIQGRSSFQMAHYRKSLNSMFFIFCLFLITYFPFLCVIVVLTAAGFNNFVLLALDITSLITMINSSINPIVYCWRVRDLKLEALHTIQRFLSSCPLPWRRVYQVNPKNRN